MKKKLISVLLSAAMATTMLAGCGSTAADTGAAPAETKATEEKTEDCRYRGRGWNGRGCCHRRRQGLLLKLQTRAGR